MSPDEPPEISEVDRAWCDLAIDAAGRACGRRRWELLGNWHLPRNAEARRIVCWLIRRHLGLSLAQIAAVLITGEDEIRTSIDLIERQRHIDARLTASLRAIVRTLPPPPNRQPLLEGVGL